MSNRHLFIFILLIFQIEVIGQPMASSIELGKHNLSWIKSSGDFNQSGLDIAAVDREIYKKIKTAVDQNQLTANIQIPFDSLKLKYIGYKNPNETGLFQAYPISTANLSHFNKKLYIYQYENFYFSTEDDKAVDQKNVYYAIRSINILRIRYPEAFKLLFTNTLDYISEQPRFKPFSNSNKGFWIAFNSNPEYIASNNTAFLSNGSFADQSTKYSNVSIVNIHSQNILGTSANGSKPVYNKENPWENYDLYMSEGLIVSIVHEMLHNYIDYAFTDNEKVHLIKSYRESTNFNRAEENAVLNSTYMYFKSKGGLMGDQFTYYYRNTFDPNIQILQNKNQLIHYAHAFSDSTISGTTDLKSIFLLPVLH